MMKPARSSHSVWSQVSHDLRQPIQSLLLLTHVMALTDDAEQRQATSHSMEAALADLQEMLDQITFAAKLADGVECPHSDRFELAQLMRDKVAAVAETADIHGKILSSNLSETWVFGDRRIIADLLSNIALNVIKFAAKGTIAVEASAAAGGHGYVEFAFSGAWPSPSQMKTLFVEIRRTAGGAPTSKPGLGLIQAIMDGTGCQLRLIRSAQTCRLRVEIPQNSLSIRS